MTTDDPAPESGGVALRRVAEELLRRASPAGVLRVAIDGPDAAGKTTFADELRGVLSAEREVIRINVDDFHQPAEVRARRGSASAEGYYLDAFDYETLVTEVLAPLGPEGGGKYLPAAFDVEADKPLDRARQTAPAGAILLLDGVFLMRPELRDHWDVTIYLHVEPDEALRRALERDVDRFGSPEAVRRRYRTRCLPAQSMYRMIVRPKDRADIVLDMGDPATPMAIRI